MQMFNFRDGHVTTFRGLYMPNAWSQTLQTSKRHNFRVSALHRYHWCGVKLFPVGCAKSKCTKKTRKKWSFTWLRPRYKILEFFTIAPVLTSTLTVCRRNRGDPSSLYKTYCALQVFKQEAQLMLTTGSTRLALSRGQQTWYHSTCNI